MSLDIVNMYLSTCLPLIKKALHHYSQNLSRIDKDKMEKGITTTAFGMKTMLVQIQDLNYNYRSMVKEGEGGGEVTE
eukprot:12355870-Ditylum_brightwellii.AAC.1